MVKGEEENVTLSDRKEVNEIRPENGKEEATEKTEIEAEKEDPDLADLSEDSEPEDDPKSISILNKPRAQFYDLLDKTVKVEQRDIAIDRKLAKRGLIPKHPEGGWVWRQAKFISEQSSSNGKGYTWKLAFVTEENKDKEEIVEIKVPEEEYRIAEFETKTKEDSSLHKFQIGEKVDILDFFKSKKTNKLMKKWRPAEVIKIEKYWVRVHYIDWSPVWDEWLHVEIHSHRIAAFAKMSQKNARKNRRRVENFKKVLARKRQLQLVEMLPDGNCLFRAVAHQVYGTPKKHHKVRTEACNYMLANKSRFAMVVGNVADHVRRMRRNREWGDDTEIRAIEEIYDRRVEIYEVKGNGSDVTPMKIHFDGDLPPDLVDDPIRMAYHGQCHYNSIVPLDLKMNPKDFSFYVPKNKMPKTKFSQSRLSVILNGKKPIEEDSFKIKKHREKMLLESAEQVEKIKKENAEKERIEKLKKEVKDEDEEKAEDEDASEENKLNENGSKENENTGTEAETEEKETEKEEQEEKVEKEVEAEKILNGEEFKKLKDSTVSLTVSL